MLDDTPVVPGDVRQPFANANEARQILNEAEVELQGWHPDLEPIHTNAAGLGANLMPGDDQTTTTASEAPLHDNVEAPAAATTHHSSAVHDATSPVTGEGSHLEKAVAA